MRSLFYLSALKIHKQQIDSISEGVVNKNNYFCFSPVIFLAILPCLVLKALFINKLFPAKVKQCAWTNNLLLYLTGHFLQIPSVKYLHDIFKKIKIKYKKKTCMIYSIS